MPYTPNERQATVDISTQDANLAQQLASKAAEAVWERMVAHYPPVNLGPEQGGADAVPNEGVQFVSAIITSFAAELLQAYLDAGSERDATHECLGPYVEAEVWGWSQASVQVDPLRQGQLSAYGDVALGAVGSVLKLYDIVAKG